MKLIPVTSTRVGLPPIRAGWMTRLWKLALWVAIGVACLIWRAPAAAQTVKECIFAAERGQVARDQRELEQARTYFQTCARDSCPELIRNDCAGWLQALPVEPAQVSLTITAVDGNEQLSPSVLVDGAKVEDDQLELAPGEHEIEVSAAGYQAYERTLSVSAGQSVTLDVTLVPSPKPAPQMPESSPMEKRSVPVVAWVLGGVAVAGGAAFAGFGLAARAEYEDLEGSCGDQCTDEQVEPVERKQLIANVSAGLAVGALIGAVWIALADTEAPARRSTELSKRKRVSSRSGLAVQVRSEIRADGGGLTLVGAF